MAKGPQTSLLDSVDVSGVPKTRKGVNEALLSKLRKDYGLKEGTNVPAALTYGAYLKNNRVYSSKAGGYVDNRTGKPWDEKAIRTELKTAHSAAVQTHRAVHPLSIAGRKIGSTLRRINKFSEAQSARNELSEHLQAKSKNWWQIRNQLSPLDKDTGLRLHELDFNKKTELLQNKVNQLENKDISQPYRVPANALKILDPDNTKMPSTSLGEGYLDANNRWISTGTQGGIIPGKSDKTNAPSENKVNNTDTTTAVHSEAGESEVGAAKKGSALKIRSDVFTIDPSTGKALGVMTNAQRRKWDTDNQEHLKEWSKNNELRIYKNKGSTVHSGAG